MNGTLVEIRHRELPRQRKLALDTCTRDALADICRERWPSNTAKLAAREWGLTLDQARSTVAARASQTTIDQILKAGGWPMYFAVGARVLCQGADQYLTELGAAHEEHGKRLAALVGYGWPDRAADPDGPAGRAAAPDHRRDPDRRRVG